MEKRSARCAAAFAFLTAALLILFVWNINSGSVHLSAPEIFQILTGSITGGTTHSLEDDTSHGIADGTAHGITDGTARRIVWDIRLPRILTAILLGGALSVSGFLLQTFFSNPIAGPFVLGISSGAKLTVSLVMVACLSRGIIIGSAAMILAAFAGSMISMGFILLISGKVKNMSVLVICGVMIGYISSAVTDFVITFADDSNIVNLHSWSMGSFSGMSWDHAGVAAAVIAVALFFTFLMAKPIGAYQLGEVYARNMGVHIHRFRVALILLSSILSACVTAFAGPISFVGIAVPHLVKSMFKTAKPLYMIPGCFLGGAVFCLFCDLIARTVFAPTELGISSVTAVFGAPVVIYMMVRGRKTVR